MDAALPHSRRASTGSVLFGRASADATTRTGAPFGDAAPTSQRALVTADAEPEEMAAAPAVRWTPTYGRRHSGPYLYRETLPGGRPAGLAPPLQALMVFAPARAPGQAKDDAAASATRPVVPALLLTTALPRSELGAPPHHTFKPATEATMLGASHIPVLSIGACCDATCCYPCNCCFGCKGSCRTCCRDCCEAAGDCCRAGTCQTAAPCVGCFC